MPTQILYFILSLSSLCSFFVVTKCACLPECLILGLSSRTSSTTATVSSSFPSTSPSCPPSLNKMACFKKMPMNSVVIASAETSFTIWQDAETIHTVTRTTNLWGKKKTARNSLYSCSNIFSLFLKCSRLC